jgi:hypothetical protein
MSKTAALFMLSELVSKTAALTPELRPYSFGWMEYFLELVFEFA